MLRDAQLSAGAIAGAFDVTRPAISRHLRVLREAGLVVDEAQGRERVYRVELSALQELEAFIAELRTDQNAVWERRFMALETEVARTKRDRRRDHERTNEEGDRTRERVGSDRDADVPRPHRGRVG
jgi:predicted ArsR family transcriptional regulator